MKRLLPLMLLLLVPAPALWANCFWNQVPASIDFGTYQPLTGGALSPTSSFRIRCTPNSNASVTISAGTAPASYTPRTLKGPGGATLPYNLFTDATYTGIWGDGTGGSVTPPAYTTPSGGGIRFFSETIYARIPAGIDVPAGTYTDTVRVDLVQGSARDGRNMTLTVIVARECTVASFSINFGNYDTVGANEATPLDATAPIDVRCTVGATATVSLGTGTHASGGLRRLQSAAGQYLNYNVFIDSTRVSVWDSITVKSGTSSSMATPLVLSPGGSVLYGRVFAGQDVAAGAYTDTLQATVNY